MQPLTHAQAVTIYIYPDWLQSIQATHSLHQRIFFRQGRQGHVSTKAYCQLYLLPLQQKNKKNTTTATYTSKRHLSNADYQSVTAFTQR